MFIQKFSNNLTKALFIELGYLMSIISFDENKKNPKNNLDELRHINPYLEKMWKEEKKKQSQTPLTESLFFNNSVIDNMRAYLWILNKADDNTTDELLSLLKFQSLSYHDDLTVSSDRDKYAYPTVSQVIQDILNNKLVNYSKDKKMKKIIFDAMIDKDIDLMALDKNTIPKLMLTNDDIRTNILSTVAKKLYKSKKCNIEKEEARIMLFELIKMNLNNRKFNDQKIHFLYNIGKMLDLSKEEVQNFIEIAFKILHNYTEADNLIKGKLKEKKNSPVNSLLGTNTELYFTIPEFLRRPSS